MGGPLVLVPADAKPIGGREWHAAAAPYLAALLRVAGATPLILPAYGPELDLAAALDAVDGVLVPGARSNVHPSAYGAPASDAHAPFDPARDATTLALIRAALARAMPLLCICRGVQELNVALGGTLANDIQDLDGRADHRSPGSGDADRDFGLRHPVRPSPEGRLAALVGADPLVVNSLHGQAIDRLADGLTIEAVAEDGTVEAVSVTGAPGFALGLQWHPEYWAGSDPPSTRIFQAFGEAVRARRAARSSRREEWRWLDGLQRLDDDVVAAIEARVDPQSRPRLDDLG